jgi:hypothetical protein
MYIRERGCFEREGREGKDGLLNNSEEHKPGCWGKPVSGE